MRQVSVKMDGVKAGWQGACMNKRREILCVSFFRAKEPTRLRLTGDCMHAWRECGQTGGLLHVFSFCFLISPSVLPDRSDAGSQADD
mmetsp:Transcript_29867/g.58592  ORF Transcript_29867/g.58592 Transcript_29867/m.58592 type:complete len:87 (-) Transcript_29867:298-558(-)